MKDAKQLLDFANNDSKELELIKKDLNRGVELWNKILFILQYQEKKGDYNEDLNKLFMRADELLKMKFNELKISS